MVAIQLTTHRSEVFRWAHSGDFVVSFTLPGEIPDAVFEEYVAKLREGSTSKILAFTLGASNLKPTQRRAAADVMKAGTLKAVVVTDSRLTRGVLTAVSWLGGKNVTTFGWDAIEDAVKATGIANNIQAEVLQLAQTFYAKNKDAVNFSE